MSTMLTPRQAINNNQVWLRPFGVFTPMQQAFMGFSKPEYRDNFFTEMVDGAIVLIWTKYNGGERGWRGSFRGVLQLSKQQTDCADASSKVGQNIHAHSDVGYGYGINAIRAWEADGNSKVLMKEIIPSMWPGYTRTIGWRSAQMKPSEIPKIEGLKIREISVYGKEPVSVGQFTTISDCFK